MRDDSACNASAYKMRDDAPRIIVPFGVPEFVNARGTISAVTDFARGKEESAVSAKPADSLIRVFLSSTFRDMHAERDALVMRVFPSVEAYCRKRGLTFVPVDLRWGVTAQQAQREQTVDICLREIDACRPYFIGMLGERYGWIPADSDISVTEREMRYGALEQSPQETNALFLLRAPSLTEQLIGSAGDESAVDKQKLRSLKRRIRASGYPTINGYRSIDSFARHVETWLRRVVDRDFPREAPDDSIDASRAQERYLRKLARQSLDLSALEAQLDDFADAQTDERLLLTGDPGCGKTTLLAHWLSRRIGGSRVFYHFYDASSRNLWQQVAARLVTELCGTSADELPKDDAALRQAVATALRTATAGSEKLILALDGMDRLQKEGRELAWLTEYTSPNVRLILSFSDAELLRLFQLREHRLLRMQPLQKREKRAAAASLLRLYGKTLDTQFMERIANAPQTANARYLHILLTELRCFGQYEGVSERLSAYLQAPDSASLFRMVLRRLEALCGDRLVRDVLGSLLLSTRGLTESELLSKRLAPNHTLSGESVSAPELQNDPSLAVGYVVAPPQMARYMEISIEIYSVYQKYNATENTHAYSIDEVFMDVTCHLETYKFTAHELAMKIIHDALRTTGINATAGIGMNLYLGKIAMDIMAKHIQADKDGVHIAELDEASNRRKLWTHRPLKDFWSVGRGYAKKLEENGPFTMGDIARCLLGKRRITTMRICLTNHIA